MIRLRLSLLVVAVGLLLSAAPDASGFVFTATRKKVTNIADHFTRHPAPDKKAKKVVFLSRAGHEGVLPPFEFEDTFDFDGSGNDFASGSPPSPACPTCADVADIDNPTNVYLWTKSSNEVSQLTFSESGGDGANRWPEIDSRGDWVAWDSDRDHVPGAPGNADANGEIFLARVSTGTITQVTDTIGGGADANRRVAIGDKGDVLVFESTRDFASVPSCSMPDETTSCANADGNAEIMVYEPEGARLMQLTATTGDTAGVANIRARVSVDGRFVVFQSTRDPGATPAAGTICTGLDDVSACANVDGSSEIFLYDRKDRDLTQVTSTGAGLCGGEDANQRADVSKKGKYVVFQSKCEDELNAGGCGACDANNEIFVVARKKQEIHQVTLSDAGRNRFPRIASTGAYIAFQSDRSYVGENVAHEDALYLLRRSSLAASGFLTSRTQLLEDAILSGGGTLQNPVARVTVPNFTGGFDTDIDRIGLSGNGQFLLFHNGKDVTNQETWLVDRKK
ncbi:MAG: hypothetical protein P8R42_15945 [Candidatus Binatia bacterium]|nr:hypothetical protein [Candidatus Binatia bacterium]